MTKIILDKWKYDELIKIQEDFNGELSKSEKINRERVEDELKNHKADNIITMGTGYIIALLEFIYILIK